MWQVRVKDRGRTLVYHDVEQFDDARELRHVYEMLGYPAEKINIDTVERAKVEAA